MYTLSTRSIAINIYRTLPKLIRIFYCIGLSKSSLIYKSDNEQISLVQNYNRIYYMLKVYFINFHPVITMSFF